MTIALLISVAVTLAGAIGSIIGAVISAQSLDARVIATSATLTVIIGAAATTFLAISLNQRGGNTRRHSVTKNLNRYWNVVSGVMPPGHWHFVA